MNYIKEINAFRNFLRTNPLDATTQALWYVIIHYHNSEGWNRRITIRNSILMGELGITENTLNSHRNKLIQAGLLIYKSQQRKKDSGRYTLLSFELGEAGRNKSNIKSTSINEADVEVDVTVDIEADVEAVPSDIYKQNKTKQKYKKESKKENEKNSSYEKIIGNFTKDEKLKEAIWGYIQMRISKRAKPTDRALELIFKKLALMSAGDVQIQISILNQSVMNNWTDIYPLKEKEYAGAKDTGNSKGKSFDNFDGRTYNADDLKQKLLAKSRGDLNAGSYD